MCAACIFITEVVAYFSKNDFLNFHYFVFVCGFDAGEQLFCCGCYQPLLGDLLIERYLDCRALLTFLITFIGHMNMVINSVWMQYYLMWCSLCTVHLLKWLIQSERIRDVAVILWYLNICLSHTVISRIYRNPVSSTKYFKSDIFLFPFNLNTVNRKVWL